MLKGIDVSSYKRDLHLGSVAADFVIAKATGGTGYVDPTCDMFVQAAIVLGRKWGVYHYYSDGYGGENPIVEADFFVDNCLGYIGKGILILDWEKGGNNYWRDTARAKQWLDHVYARTGVKPIVYMSASLVSELDWSAVIAAGYGLWAAGWPNNNEVVANYAMDPNRDPNPRWDGTVNNVLWQFTSTGRLDGYGGNLDCNFFYGNTAAWDAYARPAAVPAPAPQPEPTTTTTTTQAPAPQPTTTGATTAAPTTTTTTTIVEPTNGGNPMNTNAVIPATLVRAAKTFIQTFLAALSAGALNVTSLGSAKALLLSALAAAISVVWNLFVKPVEAK